MIKVIGIGNVLMGDDGIGIKVVEALDEKLRNIGVDCIKAETDVDYALDNIKDGDFLFIIDSISEKTAKYGEIMEISIEQVVNNNRSFSVHNMSLISAIRELNIKVSGIILGIKAESIEFNFDLSDQLKSEFNIICSKVYEVVEKKIFEYERKEKGNA